MPQFQSHRTGETQREARLRHARWEYERTAMSWPAIIITAIAIAAFVVWAVAR